ncbi:MAG TPA: glycosyltransferase family 9 protein [Vicinamibacterales bacterium]|nr:glycosyltransferase family 9 protein [Vicinamibacterales bacterium]
MNILLVRLRLIGDVVFTTPAIRAIRRHYPAARLTYIVEEDAAPVVRGNPHLDEVIVVCGPHAPGRLRADIALVRRLRRARYDLAIDFHGGPRASLLTWLSGAPTRIGYEVLGRGWMYTTRVPRPRALRPRHSVVSQFDVLRPLGIAPPDPETDATEMPENPAALDVVARRLAEAGVGETNPLVIVHVSAGNPFRRWPKESFVDLICRLVLADPQRRIVLTSGPSDADAASAIAREARAHLGVRERVAVVECGEFDLPQLHALIGRAALYVGGDSGPMHIAGTTGVPVVGLYGPTLPVRSQPYRSARFISAAAEVDGLPCRPCNQRRCEPGDFRCLTRISAGSVAELAEQVLDTNKRLRDQEDGR